MGCEVLEIEPLERLRISWCGGPADTEVPCTPSEPTPGCALLDQAKRERAEALAR